MKRFLEIYTEAISAITSSQLNALEQRLDSLFAALNIDIEFTAHFLDRVNDARNIKQITIDELSKIFKSTYDKYGSRIAHMNDKAEAVMTDMSTDINVPFVIDINKDGSLELYSKTVMRKHDFKTRSKKFIVR